MVDRLPHLGRIPSKYKLLASVGLVSAAVLLPACGPGEAKSPTAVSRTLVSPTAQVSFTPEATATIIKSSTATRTRIPVAEVDPATVTPVPFEFVSPTEGVEPGLFIETISPTERGIRLCTKGRDVGTTLKVSYYEQPNVDPNIPVEQLADNYWRDIYELGVPCFNDVDRPVWNISDLESGIYLIRGLARPSEAMGKWDHLSVISTYQYYPVTRPESFLRRLIAWRR